MSDFRFRFGMLRIFCTSEVLRSAMKPCVSGGAGLVQCSRQRPARCGQTGYDCDRQTAVLWRCNEGYRQCAETKNKSLAEQSGREFPPAFSTTRAGDAEVPPHAKFAEIRLRPFFNSQSFQPRAPPILSERFQAEPDRRSGRVASVGRGIKGSLTVLIETGSN